MTIVRVAFLGEGTRRVRHLPLHAHAAPLLIWYTRGHGRIGLADGTTLAFARDHVAGIPAGTRYREDAPHGFTSLYLGLSGLAIPAPRVVPLGPDPRFRLAARLLLAQARAEPEQPARLAPALAAVVQAWQDLAAPATLPPAVVAAHELIRLHAADPAFTPDRCARRVGLTPRQLRTACSRWLGHPPRALLQAERLRLAAGLLAHGGFAIAEVAARAGFADPFYFARAFRRHAGCPPSAYRSAWRGATAP